MAEKFPWWLVCAQFLGAEDPPNSGDGGSGDGDEGGDDGDSGNSGDDGNSGLPADKTTFTREEVEAMTAGLKSALQKERTNAKLTKAEKRELAEFKRQQQEKADAEKGEVEAERKKRERAEEKLNRLAPAWRTQAVRDAVLAEARNLKFIDPSDALVDDVLSKVEADQDEEDPSQVDVDQNTVKRAVKALADKKKHLVDKGSTNPGSGSSFGGRRDGGNSEQTEEERLRKEYRL